MLILTAAYIPISFVFVNTEVILVAMGMDAQISEIAQQYVVLHLPGLFMCHLFCSFAVVFSTINYSYIVTVINLAILPFHAAISYLFVVYWDFKINGCAYSFDISMTLAFAATVAVAGCLEGFKDAWFFPTLQTFSDLGEYLSLALPCVVMMFLEFFNWEVLTIMAGMMKSETILASLVIISTFSLCIRMIPFGFSCGAAAVIGKALGANKPELAKKTMIMISVSSSIIFALICLVLFLIPS